MLTETAEWLTQAEYDLDTADSLYQAGRYIYTIFMCHLAVEKTLKALVVERTGKVPPKTHNLIQLIKLGQPSLNNEQTRFVTRLSLAGIVTRYPEELKKTLSDYPPSVTRDYLKRAKDVFKCLKQQIG
ncbi:HEPN domain protein [Pelotomaculum sp. FP]|uniref:HEPN domain-containing protein n=1 Tax=Pelotomaculum sp. FP TaxID=261474 RepID=UPI001065ECC8|nr:HEPN domain-containing protein [Pelotomaculum sp. FP]TEB10831.1 HEPN domain protein [Pelotomaculum sp. FP]